LNSSTNSARYSSKKQENSYIPKRAISCSNLRNSSKESAQEIAIRVAVVLTKGQMKYPPRCIKMRTVAALPTAGAVKEAHGARFKAN
jgi:predicted NodU family carbamoyl transferase